MLKSLQVEKHCVSGIIQNPDIFSELIDLVSEKDFTHSAHSVVYSCLKSFFLKNLKFDITLISEHIHNLGISFKDDLSIYEYLESITFTKITPEATKQACQELVKLRVLRDIDKTADEIKNCINKSVNEDLSKIITDVDSIYGSKIANFEYDKRPEDLYSDLYQIIEERGNNPIDDVGMLTPFPEFNRLLGGFRGGGIYAFASRPKQGKALEENTLIPTPSGWSKIKDLKIGDLVFAVDGSPTKVLNIAFWKNRNLIKVETSDGHSVLADESHEWFLKRRVDYKEEIYETKFLLENQLREGKGCIIKCHNALKLEYQELPLDPYFLGIWLGDGSSSGPQITNGDYEIISYLQEYAKTFENKGIYCSVNRYKKYSDVSTIGFRTKHKGRDKNGKYHTNYIKDQLQDLNLIENKHIPIKYLRASEEQRIKLLQGLIDSDGYVDNKYGEVEFCNKNKVLAYNVKELVLSLGVKATILKNKSTLYGKDCGFRYRVKFQYKNAALLSRKAKLCQDSPKRSNRYVFFEKADIGNTVCIEIEHSSHLFLCGDGMIPTHNSSLLNYLAAETGKLNNAKVLILDTEMITNEVRFRSAAAISGVPSWYLETGNFRKNEKYLKLVREHLSNLKNENKVYHIHVGNKPVEEILSIIRKWYLSIVGRGNKCIVVYDYIKLTGEKLSSFHNETQAIGEKVNKLKTLATELDFPLLTAIQLNRGGENLGKQSADITDDGSAVALSDRLQWFCSLLCIFRRRTEDELLLDTPQSGSHKMLIVAKRHEGREGSGHNDYILRTFPDGKKKYVQNFLNYNIDNFRIEERGSLIHSIQRQNASFKLTPDNNTDQTL